jgi:putative membrane protein
MIGTRATAVLGSVAVGTVAAASVLLAPSATAAPSAQDVTYLKSNEQVNLAEITIGTIALKRATTATARSVATMTISDHQKAMTKVKALAAAEKVTLPTAPNALQQSQAATLKSIATSKFDLTYLQYQVAGHNLSIAATNTEISGGSDAKTVAYAKFYLPVATMHLKMARAGVTTLGGDPNGVPAGTGGQGATTSDAQLRTAWGGGIIGLVLVALGGVGLIRRRRLASI